ncbi:MAG: (Fe-S)-binding protein [Bradyrhizobium sp.]
MNSAAGSEQSLDAFLAAEADAIASACTRCGKCVEVCPVVPFSQAAGADPADVARGVADFLGVGTAMSGAAGGWLSSCNGCGECIPACPEQVNPRRMLMLAATRDAAATSKTPELFRRMTRAIKVMAAMQLVPEEFARLLVPPRPRDADVVFYLGCNALRTPHLIFNTMHVLDALGVDYDVVGGPSSCCGVISTKWEGSIATGERVSRNTISRFGGFKPEKVLNWCPTCQLHLGETLKGFHRTEFEFDHITEFLVSREEDLIRQYRAPVRRRAVLHTHAGCAEIGGAVERLMRAIPGLELVESVVESGYTCGGSGCGKAPQLAAIEHAALLDRARQTKADTLITLYHGCHATFAGAAKEREFDVLNFTDVLVEAIGGIPHRDLLKSYKLSGDWEWIVAQAQPLLRANGIELSDDWLKKFGPEIFASAEFRGGLDCFGSTPPGSDDRR